MPKVRIIAKYCKGCGLCLNACPRKGLRLSGAVDRRGVHVAEYASDKPCTGCANCAAMCPDAAIEIDP